MIRPCECPDKTSHSKKCDRVWAEQLRIAEAFVALSPEEKATFNAEDLLRLFAA